MTVFAGAAHRAGPESKLSFLLSYSPSEIISRPLIGAKYGDVTRRRETSYDVARQVLMVPSEPWRNSTPFFGATWLTHSSKRRPLRCTSLKRQIIEVIEVDHIEETINRTGH